MRQTQNSSNTSSINNGLYAGQILAQDPNIAIKAIIKMTQSLIIMAEKEAQALAKNDMLALAILQDEKDVLTKRYVQLSQEFRTRLEEFRGVDRIQLDKLESLQKELSDVSNANNFALDRIQKRSKKKTESSLLTAQELAQSHMINFEKPELSDENNKNEKQEGN